MQVRDIMTPSDEPIDANTMIRDAAVRMRNRISARCRWATAGA